MGKPSLSTTPFLWIAAIKNRFSEKKYFRGVGLFLSHGGYSGKIGKSQKSVGRQMRGEIVLLPEEKQSERRRYPPTGRNFGNPVPVVFPAGGGHGSPADGRFVL
jgi:hypothetical protein